MERLRLAVTGSHGLLGEALVVRLEQQEHKVLRLDRSGVIPEGVDFVFDIAAYGNLASQRKNAKEIYQANLLRVFTEMEYLKENTGYIYVSSSSVARPKQNLYSLSKRAAEEYLGIQDKKIAIVRPFSITGVGDQPEHLIPTAIRSCLYGERMPFVAEPHHDYIDIEDVVSALIAITNKGQFVGEIYQVGRGESYSNQQVLEMVEEATGKSANIEEVDSMRDYDSKDWVADTIRIRSLGWEPRKSIRESIGEMVEHERKNIRN